MTDARYAIFRADASAEIGTGHVVRSRTLAAELVGRGWDATLVARGLPAGLAGSIRAMAVGLLELPKDLAIEDEPTYIGTALSRPADLAVIDHYDIGADWQLAAADWAKRQLAIDDLADRAQATDILLDQNLPADPSRYRGLVRPTTQLLLGPAYALVQPAFAAARARRQAGSLGRDGRLQRILVFMSGTDPQDVTRRAARAAAALDVAVDVVVGAGYPFQPELRAWVAGQPLVELHVDTQDMAGLMARADLAVGASGSANWERCTLGLPAVLVTLADNQVEGARALADVGAVVDLGSHARVADHQLERALIELRDDPERLVAMSETAARLTDGLGTIRVADELERLVWGPR